MLGVVKGDENPPLRAHSIRVVSTSAVFFAKLVGFQGAGGHNLEIKFSFCLFLF